MERPPRLPGIRARILVLCLAALASTATSAPMWRSVRAYPAWEVVGPVPRACDLWVSKSGKQGLGVSGCAGLVSGRLLLSGGRVVPGLLTPPEAGASLAYLGFAFDNQGEWNADRNDARLEITLADGSVHTVALVQRRAAPHTRVPYHDRPGGAP